MCTSPTEAPPRASMADAFDGGDRPRSAAVLYIQLHDTTAAAAFLDPNKARIQQATSASKAHTS
jgi:hypothetical protein